jgi:hypothetical protein
VVTGSELATLKRRVAELEGEVKGEKVSRHILRKADDNEGLLLEVRRDVGKIGDDLALVRAQFTSFQEKLPGIVSDALREVLQVRGE